MGNIVLLIHILQIFLNWYDLAKMLRHCEKTNAIKQNLKKYGADLMINHWRKLLKKQKEDVNENEMKQVKNAMSAIRKCRRILDLDLMDDEESESESDEESESDDRDDDDMEIND